MDWDDRRAALQDAFTPARPVNSMDLFAGRTQQLDRVVAAFRSPGDHAAIFGERGVGKTSLASIAEVAATLSGRLAIRINCQANDDSIDIWQRMGTTLERNLIVTEAQGKDTTEIRAVSGRAIELLTSAAPRPQDVLTALQILTLARPVVIFLDEFDRVGETRLHSDLVDLMKTCADQPIDVTFIVVGVAATVDGLIDEHQSIGRGLDQIEMPRMSPLELKDILDRGLSQATMSITSDAAEFAARVSMGLPHYVHLMGRHAGLIAAHRHNDMVSIEHMIAALPHALDRAEHYVQELYFEATHSTQANIFREVLLGAALTGTDDRGYFAPGDVREPLSQILGRPVEIPAFARHLSQFADERGPVLQKSGQANRPRYRFSEPLLVPFIAMRGVVDQLVDPDALRTAYLLG